MFIDPILVVLTNEERGFVHFILSIRSTAREVLSIVSWESGKILDIFFDRQRSLVFHESGVESGQREFGDFVSKVAGKLGLIPADFRNRIKRVCLGLSGTRTAKDEETVQRIVRLGDLSQIFITTELNGTLIGNSPTVSGIVVNAGIGSMMVWRTCDGYLGRLGGWVLAW